MKSRKSYPVCERCGAEINPNKWDDCERYFEIEDEICCQDCFKLWLQEWIDSDIEAVAKALQVDVVEVR